MLAHSTASAALEDSCMHVYGAMVQRVGVNRFSGFVGTVEWTQEEEGLNSVGVLLVLGV